MLARVLVFLGATALAAGLPLRAPTPPSWGGVDKFAVSVNFTNPKPQSQWVFNYYHISSLKAERYEHPAPQYDEMCALAPSPYGDDSSKACTVVFATDGWSYLQFPQDNFCCKCENSFGAVRGDWLQDGGADYQGTATINGVESQHWTKQGQYLNHYYSSIDGAQPVRFNELWGPEHALKEWDFMLDTFKSGSNAFDESLVAPLSCALCDGSCANFRL
mmetsp:Transcript_9371/g.25460  ORF Transcript_9371/g.25460 Transcript_9371/m.25460 type:complete len:218 (-) Transcript_9371:511-1164(-)